jgi:hypothetical protein
MTRPTKVWCNIYKCDGTLHSVNSTKELAEVEVKKTITQWRNHPPQEDLYTIEVPIRYEEG